MGLVPASGLLSLFDNFVDRAIGAATLPPLVRQKLLSQQLASISRMTPAIFAAAAVVSAMFLVLTWQTARFLPVLAGSAVILLLHGHIFMLTQNSRAWTAESRVRRAANVAVLYALMLGMLWGVLLNLLPLDGDATVRGAATIGVGGLLCISMLALVNYPQALAAFAIPLVIGAMGTVLSLDSPQDVWVQSALLLAFTLIMVVSTCTHAAAFVAHRASETQVKEKGEIIGLLLREFEQSTSDWIWGFDEDGHFNRVSAGFTTATGVSEAELLGADFVYFLRCITPPGDPLMVYLERDILERQTFQAVELRVVADGRECWWCVTGKPAFDEGGSYLGYIGTAQDVTDRKIAERRITSLAHHDPMTGLLNRTKFTEQLNSCVARLDRYGTPFTVMFLDLDQFKTVNDSLGHMVGDKVLIEVARRVSAQVRDTDLAARLGGDEFAVILPNDGSEDGAAALAARLIEAIRQPYLVDEDQVQIGVSIGIAIAPINGTRPDEILRNADLALYRAKADGRSVFRFFEVQMDSEARERRLLEVDLRDALLKNELVLYYQPLVSASDEQPVGFEALIRWKHPIRGLVSPAEFIPIAEQSSLSVDIGDWTIMQACLAAATWPAHLSVAVNVSARHFRRSEIAIVVQKALSMSGLEPHRLEIEITEGLLLEDPDGVVQKLAELRALGVCIAMDDFGTGYASLGHLLKFPFDKIKIDRSFVAASSGGEVARDTLKAIAALGRTLKLTITAEGVETREQADFLSAIACQQLQGFLFSRPLDPVDLPHYLLTHVPTRAPLVKAEAEARLSRRSA